MTEQILQPSTLENVDQAFFNFINDQMNIFSNGTKGWKKVPVIWSTTERTFLTKANSELTDKDGSLIKPIISICRTDISKDDSAKGTYYGNVSNFNTKAFGGFIPVARILKQDKTKNFANNDAYKKFGQINYKTKNDKVVYETVFIPAPKYIKMTYIVSLYSEFMQQMNEMVTPFFNISGPNKSFLVRNDGHKYECFLKEFSDDSNSKDLQEESRKFDKTITFEVYGYILGGDANAEIPATIRVENAVEVKFPREHVIFGDIPDTIPKAVYRGQ